MDVIALRYKIFFKLINFQNTKKKFIPRNKPNLLGLPVPKL